MDAIFNFDSSILLWIQDSVRADFLSPIMKVITHLGDKGAFWILLTLALLIYPNRKGRRLGLMCGVSMAIGLLVTNLVIKNWVARVRPYELIQGLECIVAKADDWSFPSGHTTNSLACAWVLFRKAPKKWGVPALVLAILIALSRLYVGIHYPTDVLGGAVIGILSACLAMWLVPKAEKQFPIIRRFYGPKKRKSATRKKAA
ncbi:MAG: phosphatase PAP2 family protein [Clostridia bacterium]|nr:phosphatase PAP2 family protein [Clostridia bacterium]